VKASLLLYKNIMLVGCIRKKALCQIVHYPSSKKNIPKNISCYMSQLLTQDSILNVL